MSAVEAETANRSSNEADLDSAQPRYSWNAQRHGNSYVIHLAGHVTLADAPALWKRIRRTLDEQLPVREVEIDLAQVHGVDGACMALLAHLRAQLLQSQIACEFSNADAEVQQVVDLYGGAAKSASRHREHRSTSAIEQIGRATAETATEAKQLFAFLGQLLLSAFATIRRPRSANFRDLGVTMERAGADVFSAAIAVITCQQGLATSGGASGVGRRTTGAVVASLFALILLDAAFTVLLQSFGL